MCKGKCTLYTCNYKSVYTANAFGQDRYFYVQCPKYIGKIVKIHMAMYKLFFSEKNTGQMSKAQDYFGPYTEYLGHSVCLDNVQVRYHKRCLYNCTLSNIQIPPKKSWTFA